MTDQMREQGKCHRVIQWGGKVEHITVDEHVFAYSGRIPCTGARRCIYCGAIAD